MRLERWGGYWRESTNPYDSGVKSTIGWNQLVEELRKTGVVKEDECVTELYMSNDGLTFTVEKRT